MSERLEEIKKMISSQKGFVKELGAHDARWFIQQAERADELERENKRLSELAMKYADEADILDRLHAEEDRKVRRYKQALEEIRKITVQDYFKTDIYVIASEALEGK